ncbi:MAG TPA: hypothetical protein VEX89_00215 [Actinomycetes bacterium]|nr:hypothetical protein [Actinomycetes bacterium]
MTTTQADPRARRRSSGAVRRIAQRAPELAPFSLDDLRAYRQELITEEARVSYWRRLVQARMDLALDNTATHGSLGSLARLREVLTDQQHESRRLAVQPVAGDAGLPPVPDLAVLWSGEADPGASGFAGDTLARLADAEHQLSAYRRSLHERLDAATGELISRYRDEPALALRALPLPRGERVGVA